MLTLHGRRSRHTASYLTSTWSMNSSVQRATRAVWHSMAVFISISMHTHCLHICLAACQTESMIQRHITMQQTLRRTTSSSVHVHSSSLHLISRMRTSVSQCLVVMSVTQDATLISLQQRASCQMAWRLLRLRLTTVIWVTLSQQWRLHLRTGFTMHTSLTRSVTTLASHCVVTAALDSVLIILGSILLLFLYVITSVTRSSSNHCVRSYLCSVSVVHGVFLVVQVQELHSSTTPISHLQVRMVQMHTLLLTVWNSRLSSHRSVRVLTSVSTSVSWMM